MSNCLDTTFLFIRSAFPSRWVARTGGMPSPWLLLLLLIIMTNASVAGARGAELLRDDYSEAKHPTRKAMRGNWKVADGIASVKQEDALYKKYSNHGPIMVYEIPHKDASSVVEFRPSGCKAVVFTMDAKNGGHAFRVIMRSESVGQPSTIQTYTEKQANGKAKPIVLSREVPALKEGQWNRIKVEVRGESAIVEYGGERFEVKHARIGQQKKIVKLGFSFGELALRDFQLDSL